MPATNQWAVSTLIREVLADPDLATAHPEERRRLDHLPQRPLRAYGQGHAGRA
mgnify:CR=1 FL=1